MRHIKYQGRTIMVPEIGEIVTPMMGARLCREFGLDDIAERVEAHPEWYRNIEFDGCSGLRDSWLGKLCKSGNWEDITYKACLPHDLEYAYPDPRWSLSEHETKRKEADERFKKNLIVESKMYKAVEIAFRGAVRLLGFKILRLPWSWGFALREEAGVSC